MAKVHHLKGYIQNIYLIEYEHGCLLLDGACRADFDLIEKHFVEVMHRPLTDLKVVMVTHMHPDHAGCAHYLRERAGCLVISGVFEKQWYAGLSGRIAHLIDIALAHWVAGRLKQTRRRIWYSSQLKPDIMLDDGQPVPHFPDWHAVSTPGHTSMDISLANHKMKYIYIADLMVQVKGELCPPYPVSLPSEYVQSVEGLYDFSDYTIMMAHVEPQQVAPSVLDKVKMRSPRKAQNNKQAILNRAKKLARFR
ncbi:MBL fold metallo-hydrolase [Ningiella sp. W23]|uniref:MBL fold metallo-hydrolase n=1 Tax=Ningiella sp. W23 TaxID=3023715 RepID=UPI003757CC8E